jgi:hypothetical protein
MIYPDFGRAIGTVWKGVLGTTLGFNDAINDTQTLTVLLQHFRKN